MLIIIAIIFAFFIDKMNCYVYITLDGRED